MTTVTGPITLSLASNLEDVLAAIRPEIADLPADLSVAARDQLCDAVADAIADLPHHLITTPDPSAGGTADGACRITLVFEAEGLIAAIRAFKLNLHNDLSMVGCASLTVAEQGPGVESGPDQIPAQNGTSS